MESRIKPKISCAAGPGLRGLRCLLISAAALSAGVAYADVVELKTGQRVEGTLTQTTPASVVIDVGGQSITFDRDKVRAIYFDRAPAAAEPMSLALGALVAMRSATSAGLNYRDYGPRLADTKVAVDRHLPSTAVPGPAVDAIREALGLYVFAGRAWSAKVVGGTRGLQEFRNLAEDPMVPRCRPLMDAIDVGVRQQRALDSLVGRGIIVSDSIAAIWSCASDKIAEAEKLLGGVKP